MEYPVIHVNPRILQANPWNTNIVSPDREAKLDESIKRLGMFKPIVCRRLEDDTLQILGGQHRNEAAIRLGHETVPVFDLGHVDEKRAKEIGLVDNSRYGDDDSLALSDLLEDLGSSAAELASFMPFAEEDLTSIFRSSEVDLSNLDDDEDEDDEVPELPATKAAKTHAVMRFRVANADAERVTAVIEAIQRTQGFTEADELTNAGDALVFLCSASSVTSD